MVEFLSRICTKFMDGFPAAIWETLYMTLISTFLAFILGLILRLFYL